MPCSGQPLSFDFAAQDRVTILGGSLWIRGAQCPKRCSTSAPALSLGKSFSPVLLLGHTLVAEVWLSS